MATLTASILIGKSHTYDGGIQPTHQLFLSENSWPAWILIPQNFFFESNSGAGAEKVTWIPTLENMLEDALLMITLYVLKDKTVQEAAEQIFNWKNDTYVETYSIDPAHRTRLYAMCRKLAQRYKIIVSVFQESTILMQLNVLTEYGMEVEVCKSRYVRQFNPWTQRMADNGKTDELTGGLPRE
jgi:hypothetical protein